MNKKRNMDDKLKRAARAKKLIFMKGKNISLASLFFVFFFFFARRLWFFIYFYFPLSEEKCNLSFIDFPNVRNLPWRRKKKEQKSERSWKGRNWNKWERNEEEGKKLQSEELSAVRLSESLKNFSNVKLIGKRFSDEVRVLVVIEWGRGRQIKFESIDFSITRLLVCRLNFFLSRLDDDLTSPIALCHRVIDFRRSHTTTQKKPFPAYLFPSRWHWIIYAIFRGPPTFPSDPFRPPKKLLIIVMDWSCKLYEEIALVAYRSRALFDFVRIPLICSSCRCRRMEIWTCWVKE